MKKRHLLALVAAALMVCAPAYAAGETDSGYAPAPGSQLYGDTVVLKLGAVGEDFIIAQERKFWITPQTEIYSQNGRKLDLGQLRVRSMLQIDFYWGVKRRLTAGRITVAAPPQ